jgi:hypothetical protein
VAAGGARPAAVAEEGVAVGDAGAGSKVWRRVGGGGGAGQ